jgi:hypothetical protein
MSRKIAEELLPRLRQHYMVRGREGRSRLIDTPYLQEARRSLLLTRAICGVAAVYATPEASIS